MIPSFDIQFGSCFLSCPWYLYNCSSSLPRQLFEAIKNGCGNTCFITRAPYPLQHRILYPLYGDFYIFYIGTEVHSQGHSFTCPSDHFCIRVSSHTRSPSLPPGSNPNIGLRICQGSPDTDLLCTVKGTYGLNVKVHRTYQQDSAFSMSIYGEDLPETKHIPHAAHHICPVVKINSTLLSTLLRSELELIVFLHTARLALPSPLPTPAAWIEMLTCSTCIGAPAPPNQAPSYLSNGVFHIFPPPPHAPPLPPQSLHITSHSIVRWSHNSMQHQITVALRPTLIIGGCSLYEVSLYGSCLYGVSLYSTVSNDVRA